MKKKKKIILVFLIVYVVLSVGLGYLYSMRKSLEFDEEAAHERQAAIEKILEEERRSNPDFTIGKARQIYNARYAPEGKTVGFDLTLPIQAFNFVALLGFLYLLLWNPLIKFLDGRKAAIKNEIDEAAKKRGEADKLLGEYNRKLAEARGDIVKMVEDGRKRGQDEEKRIIEEAWQDVTRLREQANAEIKGQIDEVRASLRKEISGISVAVASRVLGREVGEQDHAQLINQTIGEIVGKDEADNG